MEKDRISIVIPTKNRIEDLKRCLNSIVNQLEEGDEIIIVDGGEVSKTKRMLDNYSHNQIKLIYDPISNIPHALNLGIESSNNDIIGFVNDDIEFSDEWVRNVKYWFNKLPEARSLGGPTHDMNSRKIESILKKHNKISKLYDILVMGGALNSTAIITEWGSFSIGDDEPLIPLKVSGFSGANMVFLKPYLREIGCFNTIFKYACFEGYSYINLFQRKSSVYLVPGCSVRHYPNPEGETRNPFYLAQDYAIFFRMIKPSSIIGKLRKILNEISFLIFWIFITKGNLSKMSIFISGYVSGIKLYKKNYKNNIIS